MNHAISEMTVTYLVDATNSAVPQGYKQTDVGIIPDDWLCTDIGALNPFVTSGSRGWAAFYSEYGQPFVRITNTKRHSIYLDLSDLKFVNLPETSSEGKRTSLVNGDVLISITADIGISSYVDDSLGKPAYINQHIALVRFDLDEINSKFVTYFLSSENVQKLFRSTSDQGAKAGLNLDSVRKIKIALPSQSEQTAIANALSDVDALIQELEKLIAKKQAIKTASMQQLLTGRTRLPQFAHHPDGRQKGYKPSELGEIPEDWELVVLGEVCDFENGDRSSNYPAANEFSAVGIPFINAGHVSDGQIDSKNMDYIPRFVFDRLGGGKVKSGDLVYCLRGSLGKFGVITDSFGFGAVASSLVIVRPNKLKTSTSYLTTYFKSEIAKKMISLWAGGAAQPNLGAKELAKFSIPLPAGDEQMAISSIFTNMDEEVLLLEQRLSKTRQIKQGMMQELLTGKTRLVKPAGAA